MSVDPNKRYYFSPVANEEIDEILNQLLEQKSKIVIWEKGKGEEEIETYTPVGYEKNEKKLSLKIEGSFLFKLAGSSLINKNILIKTELERLYFFTSGMLRFDDKTANYYIVLNEQLLRSQRRSNYRIEASKNNTINITIEKKTYSGLDISAGGSSFIIDNSIDDHFEKGKQFEKCKVSFNQVDYKIPVIEVAGVWELERSSDKKTVLKSKIGIKFLDMPLPMEEALSRQINQEARKEEIRKSIS